MNESSIRPGEITGSVPDRADATLVFIGRIRTPFHTRDECPRQGRLDGPTCRIEIDAPWRQAMQGLQAYPRLQILYWMDRARRDLLVQVPHGGTPAGTFALRSPMRPNPIATSIVAVTAIEDGVILVRGLDCLDGTPLLDIKPWRPECGAV
ncbi:MAG: tRNA (N6-threonylcarbamoyladenosine(37)-N6)-methyltransferase TrmO [Rhodomicrobium sp.]